MPMSKNKDSLASNQVKNTKQEISKSKAAAYLLKNYNSCLHQKNINKKDIQFGPTIYISSVEKHELTKTLQAYYSIRSPPYALESSQRLKNCEKTEEFNDKTLNINNKIKCEGICAKFCHVSVIKIFFHENQRKYICSNCIDQILIKKN